MAWFSALVELQIPLEGAAPPDSFIERLERWRPAVAASPRGRLAAQLSIDTATLGHAAEIAQLVVIDAARSAGYPRPEIVALEVMSEAEFEARQAQPSVPELIGAREAAEILGVTRQRVQQLAERLGGVLIGHSWGFPRAAVEAFARTSKPATERLAEGLERTLEATETAEAARRRRAASNRAVEQK